MITVKLPIDNHSESLVLTHFCETHGPSVVFTTQSEYVSPNLTHNNIHHQSGSRSHQHEGTNLNGNVRHNNGEEIVDEDDVDHNSNNKVIQMKDLNLIEEEEQQQQQQQEIESLSPNNNSSNSSINGDNDQQQKKIYTTLPNLFSDPSFQQYQVNEENVNNNFHNNNDNNNSINYSRSLNISDLTPSVTKVTSIYPIIISNDSNTTTATTTTTTTTTTTSSSSSTSSLPTATPSKCPTCSSIPQATGLVSQDKYESSLFYISTHQPSNNSYSGIRSACVRSLSCELVPGREGPVLIGSSDGCFLSYMFKVNDSRARGSARWYGFLFMLGDSACLVGYFGWVVSCFQRLAHEIKQRTDTVYNRERSQQPNSQTTVLYRRGVRTTTLKPLPELAEDTHLFIRLHRSFASILATCRMRFYRLVGRPPALLDEQRLAMENLLHHYVDDRNIEGEAPTLRAMLDAKLKRYAFPVVEERIESLGQVCKIVGESSASALIYNVVVGNQVLVRGQNKELVGSLINCLVDLAPSECMTVCRYSETFKEIWECNIVGLAPNVVIPRHVDRTVIAIVDIDYYDSSKEPEDIDHPDRSTIEISFSGPKYESSMGNAIEYVILQNYPPQVEKIHLLNIKEEWINKTKAFYGVRSIIEDDRDKRLQKFMQIINCVYEKDIMILMFWTTCVRKQFVYVPSQNNQHQQHNNLLRNDI